MIEEQVKMIKRLKKNNIVSFEEILNILEAFQIASAQGYATMKTKGILDYLKNHQEIFIDDTFLKVKYKIKDKYELSAFYNKIDPNINIEKDKIFLNYFGT